jgi:hypothetical protein
MEELNQQQALNVLIRAAQVAQSKGAFTLDDAELVNKAVRTFIPKEQNTSELTKDPAATENAENTKAETTETAEA